MEHCATTLQSGAHFSDNFTDLKRQVSQLKRVIFKPYADPLVIFTELTIRGLQLTVEKRNKRKED